MTTPSSRNAAERFTPGDGVVDMDNPSWFGIVHEQTEPGYYRVGWTEGPGAGTQTVSFGGYLTLARRSTETRDDV